MDERLKFLRKEILKMSQQEFADKLNIKRGTIANYEIGRNVPIDAVVKLICKTFNVNEKWLREGVGEPLIPITRNQYIQAWVNDVMADEDDSFRKRFAEALSHSSPEFWKELEKIALDALGGKIPDDKDK